MSRRKTVQLNVEFTTQKIKKVFRRNVIFCEAMGRSNHLTWVTDWSRKDKNGNPAPKNLPSPEEAAKMCVLLKTTPEEILVDPADIELVRGLLEQERAKEKAPDPKIEGVSAAKRALLDAIDDLTDEQCEKMLGIVLEAKKLL